MWDYLLFYLDKNTKEILPHTSFSILPFPLLYYSQPRADPHLNPARPHLLPSFPPPLYPHPTTAPSHPPPARLPQPCLYFVVNSSLTLGVVGVGVREVVPRLPFTPAVSYSESGDLLVLISRTVVLPGWCGWRHF